jgi:hypothetical protein
MLDVPNLMAAAEAATGCRDWGDPLFEAPLGLLVDDLHRHAALNELGLRRTERRLGDALQARLRLVDDRKREPSVADEIIRKPIFVIGLPRAGTTFLHALLAQDPAHRSPATWEIRAPSPWPEEATYHADPRIAETDEALRFEGFMDEAVQAAHPFGARRAEECNFMWEASLLSVNFMAMWNVPNYRALLYATDFLPVYREHRAFLQQLQHRFRRDRWVLKSPAHSAWLPELLTVYPDACIVQCHRDPAKVIPSLSSNLVALRRLFSDQVETGDFGMAKLQADSLDVVSRVRARPGVGTHFFDAHYLDVQADPLAVVRAIYAHFDLPYTPATQASMQAFLARDRTAHASGPRHSYTLEQYGIDLREIDSAMGPYVRQYGVRLERGDRS